jgi:hypothetical protein
LGEELEQAAHQIQLMLPLQEPQQQNSAHRLVRLTDNDEEWLSQLRSRSGVHPCTSAASMSDDPEGFSSTADCEGDSSDEEMMEAEEDTIFGVDE